MKKFYLTTTLPYVNAEPHIAHALEFVLGDAITRYMRKKLGKDNVFFNVGTDEHGQKILEKSREEGLGVHDFTDKYVKRFEDFCEAFNVSYDFFYRTSKSYHYPVAQAFWNSAVESGDIYKKIYKGLYCVGCERFRTEKEIVDGKCPDHGKPVIQYEEENYFFRLSKYQDSILKYLQNSEFVIPEDARNFAIEFCKSELQDISISRDKKSLSWGIPIPNDDSQVMYVWFDALTNYIGSIYYQNNTNQEFLLEKAREKMENWEMVQLCGSDNIRFQSIIWQGMLASAKLPFTSKLLVHAWILGSDGKKMSKTLGNVVSPFSELEKYGADAVRYFMLACMPTTGDAVYNSDEFKNVYNSAVADNFGNLLNRTLVLKEKFGFNDFTEFDSQFKADLEMLKDKAEKSMEEYNIYEYCKNVNLIGDLANRFMTNKAPWSKECENPKLVIGSIMKCLDILIDLYEPIIPETSKKARLMFDGGERSVLVNKLI